RSGIQLRAVRWVIHTIKCQVLEAIGKASMEKKGVSQHILTDETRQLPESLLWFRLLHRGFLGGLLCAALGKPGRLLRKPLRESPAAPSPALRPLLMSAPSLTLLTVNHVSGSNDILTFVLSQFQPFAFS